MHPDIVGVYEALDEISTAIISGTNSNQTLTEISGWSFAPLDRHDLAFQAKSLSEQLKKLDIEHLDEDYAKYFSELPRKIKLFQAHTLPYMFNGNGSSAVSVYTSLISSIHSTIIPLFSWEIMRDAKSMPYAISRRVKSYNALLDEIAPDKDVLYKQIKLIEEATATAESLPTDMQSLSEARKKIDDIATQSIEFHARISDKLKDSNEMSKQIRERRSEANRIVDQCEEAYRITTTKGLAAAFDQRALSLTKSIWAWVIGLILSLIFAGVIGADRVHSLTYSLDEKDPNWGIIVMKVVLSVISLGVPLWFSWLATKQIGQRFKLTEDYAYKASVAKAYEGYRKEAARLDEKFESRLFSSALTRLEEAPLRLVEKESHGSPLQEFLKTDAAKEILDTAPSVRDKLLSLINMPSQSKKPKESADQPKEGL